MCKAFMDMKLEGIQEGKLEGMQVYLIQVVCKKLQKNKPAAVIAEELEEELPTVENIIRIQCQLGNYDTGQIYKALQAEQAETTEV